MRTMAAGKFKATCLAVMDEVQAKREPVLVDEEWEAGGEACAIRIARWRILWRSFGSLKEKSCGISSIYSDKHSVEESGRVEMILLDTHVAVMAGTGARAAFDPPRLSTRVRSDES